MIKCMILYNVVIVKMMQNISDSWFYSSPHLLLRLLTIYVKGDMLIIIPGFIIVGLLGFFSLKFMFLIYGIFFSLRGFGEMIYWFLHQFSVKQYRPNDFGFKKLSNDAIYILYQLFSTFITVLSIGFVLWILLYMY